MKNVTMYLFSTVYLKTFNLVKDSKGLSVISITVVISCRGVQYACLGETPESRNLGFQRENICNLYIFEDELFIFADIDKVYVDQSYR